MPSHIPQRSTTHSKNKLRNLSAGLQQTAGLYTASDEIRVPQKKPAKKGNVQSTEPQPASSVSAQSER